MSKADLISLKFLQDEPISEDSPNDVQFGHTEIAKSLAKIIRLAPAPFSIGLFGKWGMGKSTILNQLSNSFGDEKIKIAKFDVWKYEADSLRRSFLIEIATQLKLSKAYIKGLEDRLYLKISEPKIAWQFTFKKFVFSLFYAAIIGLLVEITKPETNILDLIKGPAGLVFLFSFALQFFQQNLQIESVSIGKDRLNSPEQFESEFLKIAEKMKGKRLLIIIDNLDRVGHKKAVETLSTIKTFLAAERTSINVIFLIACDDLRIKEHIKSVYTKELSATFDPDEFLRKFFNTTVRIPPFLGIELEDYVIKLFDQVGGKILKNNQDLVWLLAYTFRDNPREIKQFINTLISQIILASEMEISGRVKSGETTSNTEQLAKLLILKGKFPEQYRLIEDAALSEAIQWRDVENNRARYQIVLDGLDNKEGVMAGKSNINFDRFVIKTADIKINNLPLLIRLMQSDEERSLTGWDSYLIAAKDKKDFETQSLLQRFNKEGKIAVFDTLAKQYISQHQNVKSEIYPFMSTTFKSLKSTPTLKVKSFFKEAILNFPSGEDLMSNLTDFRPKYHLETITQRVNKGQGDTIKNAYLGLFDIKTDNKSPIPTEFAREIFRVVTTSPKVFQDEEVKIKKAIEDLFYWDIPSMNLFTPPDKRKFITDAAKNKFLESITNDDLNNVDEFKKKLDLLIKLI